MSVLKQAFFCCLFSFIPACVIAQGNAGLSSDPYHHWDGITHWTKYQIVSAGKFGPNALPVPEIKKGRIDSTVDFELSAVNAYNKRDNTPSIGGRLYYPVIKNKIAVEVYGVIAEYFNMDSTLRYERRTFALEGQGIAFGDLNIGTIINLVKDREKMPDVALSMSFRTASGGQLKSARYTDAPGYWFDVSFGKTVKIANCKIRWYGLGGFYVWQTNIDNNPQDDAFLFGGGFDVSVSGFIFSTSINGYLGYVNNGDQPVVYRASLTKRGKKADLKFGYQYGLHDYNYQTLSISAIWHLEAAK